MDAEDKTILRSFRAEFSSIMGGENRSIAGCKATGFPMKTKERNIIPHLLKRVVDKLINKVREIYSKILSIRD